MTCGARFGHLVCDREPHDDTTEHRGYDAQRDAAMFWSTKRVVSTATSAQACGCDPGANWTCEDCRKKAKTPPPAFAQWSATCRAELEAAGFTVEDHLGFPLVKRPEEWDAGIRLLKLPISVGAEKNIYAEGMLFLPPGSRAMR